MNWNVEFIDVHVNDELTGGEFAHIIGRLRARLQDTCTRNRPVLPPVNNDRLRWFEIRLYLNPTTPVRLRLRRDNLYLQGYQMANSEQWLELGDRHLIDPNSTLLGIGHVYGSVLREAVYECLQEVGIGRISLQHAANQLATSGNRRERARALLVVAVMFCESTRFIDVLTYIRDEFLGSDSRVPEWMENLVHKWGRLSNAVLYYDAHIRGGVRWVPQKVPTYKDGEVTANTIEEVLRYIGILQRDPETFGPPSPD